MKVLVVDDDEAGRYLAATILKSYGHEVVEAADGLDAVAVGRRERVDVVLTDILMPTMDGYTFCRVWKADPELSRAPVVFYTATYTDPEDEAFARSIGVDAFITKPQEPARLVELVEQAEAECRAAGAQPRVPAAPDETAVLREYNERLVSKLEQKVLEAGKANDDLRAALEVLSDEVEVKKTLIEQLTADVEERERRVEELAEANQTLAAVVADCPVPVVLVDRDLRIRVWNPAAERVFGYTVEDLERMELEFSDSEQSLVSALLGGSMGGAAGHVRRGPRKDGTLIEYSASVTVTRDADGRPTGFVAVVPEWREVAHGE